MRERWFGATGRKVPEIALDGSVELGDALVLDSVSDLGSIRSAHTAGTPVVVRCATADDVHAALSIGAVACALVTDESLLEVDLGEMTYG